MTVEATVPDPPAEPSRSARLVHLVRKLIDYGKEFAATIRRRAFTDPGTVIARFGTADVAQILARISRGLHRANALEARLLRNADRLDAAPRGASPPGRPRAPRQATAPSADETDARITRLPTPEQIAAKVRRQPIGTVIADICRDLGILPAHPLWRELQVVIVREGGSLANLMKDFLDQAFPTAAPAPPGSPAPPHDSLDLSAPARPESVSVERDTRGQPMPRTLIKAHGPSLPSASTRVAENIEKQGMALCVAARGTTAMPDVLHRPAGHISILSAGSAGLCTTNPKNPRGLTRIFGKTPTRAFDFLDPSNASFPSKINAATDDTATGRDR